MQRFDHRRSVALATALLLAEDLTRISRSAGEEEHESLLQRLPDTFRELERVDLDPTIGELDEVQATESGGVLVLFPDGHSQLVDLDSAGQLGNIVPAQSFTPKDRERFDQCHGDRTRGAESGARGDLRRKENGQASIDAKVLDDGLW